MTTDINTGDTVTVDGKGKYLVISCPIGQYVRYEIEDIDRGPGWDTSSLSYEGIKVGNQGWYLGRNNCFGDKYIIHRKRLEKIYQDVKK